MELEQALSSERLERYKRWAEGNQAQALALYTLNVQISEALYISLHMLEITLRNAIHNALTEKYGEGWFNNSNIPLSSIQKSKVSEAISRFQNAPADGKIVAELTFGFWTAMFGRDKYILWGQCFQHMFDAGYPVKRKQVATRFDKIRKLRNRIAHHEPIIQRDLLAEYSNIRELIGWMSTDALQWMDTQSRFTHVHPKHLIIEGGLIHPELK